MGVDIQTLRLLLIARGMGVDFSRMVTLGRQDLLVTPEQLSATLGAFGIQMAVDEAAAIRERTDGFADGLFERLGAGRVDSMDASSFEGATIIHDLNRPLAAEHRGRFTLVLDGGTIEHVFDVPAALRTLMALACVGGHVVMASPANNMMGHGLYQFSPDLLCRVFSKENGFELRALFLAPAFADGRWYRVKDPAAVGARVGHNGGGRPLYLFAIARKTAEVPVFSKPPQQSDYAAEWAHLPKKGENRDRLKFFDDAVAEAKRAERGGGARRLVKGLLPGRAVEWLKAVKAARAMGAGPDPRHFETFEVPGAG